MLDLPGFKGATSHTVERYLGGIIRLERVVSYTPAKFAATNMQNRLLPPSLFLTSSKHIFDAHDTAFSGGGYSTVSEMRMQGKGIGKG